MTTIRDHDHARHLVAIGDIAAEDVRDSNSARYLRDAFAERLAELGNCTTCAAIDEGKFLCGEIEALESDWMPAESPECAAHLY